MLPYCAVLPAPISVQRLIYSGPAGRRFAQMETGRVVQFAPAQYPESFSLRAPPADHSKLYTYKKRPCGPALDPDRPTAHHETPRSSVPHSGTPRAPTATGSWAGIRQEV